MAMVVRANRGEGDLGGHIASYASVGTLMEIGFNHSGAHRPPDFGGDLIYIQGALGTRQFMRVRFSRAG